ncbi:D-alanyl-D-alanine carboxypeptidase/D-alanyl-D-alanine-endopeptidase [Pseudooceanicola sp.]|uniref:D-alanyl-D-alanine carboxypeptidase/D-alanyl-D-alanine endopeptidase n=1 Tax=Pseudooceanicola sp. TaxID=1914328 RepID=UPI002630BC3F|nr:D-alanyl-D-alanine carboxypeptidase/D-alanyl-D-alanine-endopeptidase [Pseudooceanicola sp.]MDF1854546.1 D-alanyl-D-alanine carboxypeptidase/D-alanyl-D-alanine-endopeptidase [Pseudooceanicola sp.]
MKSTGLKPGALTRRLFLGTGLAALAAPVWAEVPARSLRPVLRPANLGQPRVDAAADLVQRAKLGIPVVFAVADATSGKMLETGDGALAVPPASVAKTLTTLYALDTLGPGFRFDTRLLATGPISNGRIAGDLVLAGGGDPTLDTNALAEMAAALKQAGVREVAGRFLVWGGGLPHIATIDRDQPDHVGYSPALSGLNLNFNRVHFEWRRVSGKWAVSMDARSAPYRPDVTVARMQVVDRQVPVYTYADSDGRDNWTVAEAALGKGGARWLPVRKPEIYAGEVFQTLAGSHGIRLKAPVLSHSAPQGEILVSHQSRPLTEILTAMLKYSTNLTAEIIGLRASLQRGGTITSLAGSAAMMNAWLAAEYGISDIRLVDHSGLGGASRVSAAAMVGALTAPGVQQRLRPLLKPVVLRDRNRKPDKHHPIKVAAKTGTLNFVSGLAGFMTGADGTDLAFAIFAADTGRREALGEDERERPPGARSWNGRAKTLQQALIERWGALFANGPVSGQ